MSILYNRLIGLCEERGITGYRACKDCVISPSVITDLRKGRKKTLSADYLNRFANYFGVTVGYLLGEEEKENAQPELSDTKKQIVEYINALTDEEAEIAFTAIMSTIETIKAMRKK